MIECTCEVLDSGRTYITIGLPAFAQDAWLALVRKLSDKGVSQVYVKLGYPRKPRTTGEGSQNHALNGFVQQIAADQGDDFDDVKMEIKRRAISKGYPFHTDSFGNAVPESEANASTVECGYLIDTAHEIASFLGINLKET